MLSTLPDSRDRGHNSRDTEVRYGTVPVINDVDQYVY